MYASRAKEFDVWVPKVVNSLVNITKIVKNNQHRLPKTSIDRKQLFRWNKKKL